MTNPSASVEQELRELVEKWPHDEHTVWKDGIDVEMCNVYCRRCAVAALLAKAEAPASQRLSEDERREYYCKGWNTLAEMIRAHFPEFDDKNILKWADDVNMVRIACDDWRERAEAAESAILAEPAPPAPEASSQKTCASADCKEPREIGLSFCKKHSLNYNIWLVQRVEKGASV